MKRLLLVLTLSATPFVCSAQDSQHARTWTSVKGTQVTAVLLEDNGRQIILRNTAGKKLSIGLDMLSQEDVAYVRQLREEVAKQKEQQQERMRKAMFKPTGTSVEAFHATRPTDCVVFEVRAHLSDYFNYEFSDSGNPRIRDLYWSVDLRTPEGRDIGNGYIPKKGRGADLFDLIKDGKWHAVIVRIRYPRNSEDSGIFHLDDFLPTE